jgi:hypothetical protein
VKGENVTSKRRIFQIMVITLLVILTGCMAAEAGNNRQSVVDEAYYSYSGVHGSSLSSPVTWNYLLRNDETIISSISVTDIFFDVYLGKWNYRVIPKVKTWSYFLIIPK